MFAGSRVPQTSSDCLNYCCLPVAFSRLSQMVSPGSHVPWFASIGLQTSCENHSSSFSCSYYVRVVYLSFLVLVLMSHVYYVFCSSKTLNVPQQNVYLACFCLGCPHSFWLLSLLVIGTCVWLQFIYIQTKRVTRAPIFSVDCHVLFQLFQYSNCLSVFLFS